MADRPEIRLRQHPRASLGNEISITLEGRAAPLRARLVDASVGGLGIACGERLTVGASITFELDAEVGKLSGKGRIVWSDRLRRDRGDMATAGVQIVALGPAGFERLDELVERHRRTPLAVVPARHDIEWPAAVAASPAPAAHEDPAAPYPASAALETSTATSASATPPVAATGGGRGPSFPKWFLTGFGALVAAVVAGLALGPWLSRESAPALQEAMPAAAVAQAPPASPPAGAAPPEQARPAPVTSAQPTTSTSPSDADLAPTEVAAPASAAQSASSPSEAADEPARPPEPAPEPAQPTVVRSITVEERTGGTLLRIRADRPISKDRVFATLIGPDPPRYLLRISGITRRDVPGQIAVGTGEVSAVRSGLHDTERGPEIHVVVDLVTRDLDVTVESEPSGTLAVDFAGR